MYNAEYSRLSYFQKQELKSMVEDLLALNIYTSKVFLITLGKVLRRLDENGLKIKSKS